MNATPKTDECIKMLGDAKVVFTTLYHPNGCYFDKEQTIDFQRRIKAMLSYRLMPFMVITMPDNADKETARANPILQNIKDENFDAFWYAMKNYQLVTSEDLSNEFWSICPDLESIPKFLGVMKIKFGNVLCKYHIDEPKEHYSGLNELVKAGELSEQEADEIYWGIYFIAKRYNMIISWVAEIYKTFRKMVEPEKNLTRGDKVKARPVFTRKFTDDEAKRLYDGFIKGGFLPGTTDYSHFLYVFGGTAISEDEKPFEPLIWQETIGLLAYMIDNLFADTDGTNLWKITENVFTVRGEKPNTDSLKNVVSKYKQGSKNKPKNYQKIDKVLRLL
jgi:hypothetical protein